MSKAVQVTYFLLRVVAGLLFFQAGSRIVLGWFGGMPETPGKGAELMTQIGIGGLIELVGGAAIMLGLFTRPVAFICSGQMAVAYWQFHAPNGAWPILNHGEAAVLLCFIFLFICAYGAGPWSLDAMFRGKRSNFASSR